ncbi:ATPase [Endozoicomonas montiporae]|uniref:ATPase n=2 Tax=Endozoicomonas montiporae TaxID=1027273 RepID=A0A081N940_9GAMM|nr:MoxR family ATPase [Endozoicomonas montiporae]AMO55097.1 MoxR-like ATPase [Endozoicomonas montiporae CL-33]KEQ14963.1 ATPase [Endozoicomonas montiporae]
MTVAISQPVKALEKIAILRQEVAKVIVGQNDLVDRLVLALLCRSHVLIEGIPGLAKTLTVNTLSKALGLHFSRIQFTPDLLPGDVTGTLIYNPSTGEFTAEKGPVFANIVLADEINRSPAKVQSALLEAMQEKQVTLGKEISQLPHPFLVLATQNPVEQEGTYPLPEAQVDRFMFKLKVDYPTFDEELEVMRRMSRPKQNVAVKSVLTREDLETLTAQIENVHMAPSLEKYIVHLISATRNPDEYGLDIADLVRFGASPRATINLALAARAAAVINGRDHVLPEDIRALSPDILRHRIALSYKAEARGMTSDALIEQILMQVAIPN